MNSPCLEHIDKGINYAGSRELVITGDVYTASKSVFNAHPVASSGESVRGTDCCEQEQYYKVEYDPSLVVCPERYYSTPKFDLPGCCTLEDMISCVPAPVAEAIRTDTLHGIKEIRSVTTLFLRLDSYNSADFSDVKTLQPFFIAMQRCLNDCGGFLRQFLIDDKGCVLIGLWGVPTASHAANCSKALRCAVMMKNESYTLNHTVSIGLTTGITYCGTVGTDYRRDYVAIGRSVNLAARLMIKANGRILMDSSTHAKLPLDISSRTSPCENLHLKGIPSGEVYHCYHSTSPPTRHAVDVRDDVMLGIEGYVRRKINDVLELVSASRRASYLNLIANCPSGCSDISHSDITHSHSSVQIIPSIAGSHGSDLLKSRSDSEPVTPSLVETGDDPTIFSRQSTGEKRFLRHSFTDVKACTEVFVIKGVSGSGKTDVMNHFINRLNRAETVSGEYPRSAVFVRLVSDDDSTPSNALRKIFREILAASGIVSSLCDKDGIIKLLKSAFPSHSEREIGMWIFPLIQHQLGIDWHWDLPESDELAIKRSISPTLSPSRAKIVAELLYYILSAGISVVAIDNAHFMCRFTWETITKLASMGINALLCLTVRVHRSYIPLYPHTLTEDYTQPLGSPESVDHSIERSMSSESMLSKGKSTKLPSRDVPTRHCIEFEAFCGSIHSGCLHSLTLRPLSDRTISTIVENEVNITLSQEALHAVNSISMGNPFLVWKIVNYFKESQTDNINEIVASLKDNSLIVSMLERVSHSSRMIIKTASIIGEEFAVEVLREIISPELKSILRKSLQSLENKGFLVTLADGVVSFSSGIIRKYVYDLVPPSDAQAIHAVIASTMQRLYKNNLSPHIFRLSYHYAMSAQDAPHHLAFEYACQAVTHLLQHGEVESLIPYLEVACNQCTSSTEMAVLSRLMDKCIATTRQKIAATQGNYAQSPILMAVLGRVEHMQATFRPPMGIVAIVKEGMHAVIQSMCCTSSTAIKISP
eukprot:CAMPEP_0185020946 /NCGR_PEP_ID=MMETSP1103-20130426/3603_1 /TAXON_ID=36769 /ORGANISM="Paraphysomonas bandaiensis, Strain Caron Lab Isolate" /LENGTH=987 /DNA_ID=CAMNT_0027552175 /DNA_START=685 /DNA_END=3648 /DNA_ORIENTATION=+